MTRTWTLMLLAAACAPSWAEALASDHPISKLPPGTWYEVPNSQLATVFPATTPRGNTGPRSVMDAWNGGAYDTKRNRLIIWGGGHGDYSGNEIYVFDIATLRWERLTEPSKSVCTPPTIANIELPCVDEPTGYYPDGLPRARHTYATVQYVPTIDRFCGFGGNYMYPVGKSTNHVDCFNFETRSWTRMADGLGAGIAAVDAKTGNVFSHANNGGQFLTEFLPRENTWKLLGDDHNATAWFNGTRMNGAVDAINRKFVTLGGGEVFIWNIDKRDANGFISPTNVTTTGDNAVVAVTGPGLDWDPVGKKLVAWHGGASVYRLDTKTLTWTKVPLASRNTVTPSAGNENGTWGRFRYIPDYDIFIAVNRSNENVYLLRPDRAAPETQPPKVEPPKVEQPKPKQADVSVTTSAEFPTTAQEEGRFSINLSNAGPDNASGVRVTIDLPTFLGSTATSNSTATVCNRSGDQLNCQVGELNANAAKRLSVRFTATKSGQTQTHVIATAKENDPAPFNNTQEVAWAIALKDPAPPISTPPVTTPAGNQGSDDDTTSLQLSDQGANGGTGSVDTLWLAALLASRTTRRCKIAS